MLRPLVQDHRWRSQVLKKLPLPTAGHPEEMVFSFLRRWLHILLTSDGAHNEVSRKSHTGKFWNKIFKASSSCKLGSRPVSEHFAPLCYYELSLVLLLDGTVVLVFLSRSKYLRGREGERWRWREREDSHYNAASQRPLGASLR